MADLMRAEWKHFEPRDIGVLLDAEFKASSMDPEEDSGSVGYPTTGEACAILVCYTNDAIGSIEAGPMFDQAQWDRIVHAIEQGLGHSTMAIGRDFTFSGYPVDGWWRSDELQIQLHSAPEEAPRPQVAIANHPFVVEFLIGKSRNWLVTNLRRWRQHRELSELLNVLLEGGVSTIQKSSRSMWAYAANHSGETFWVQEGYACPGFTSLAEQLSDPRGDPLLVVPAAEYYLMQGHEVGRGLHIPDTLEASISAYRSLAQADLERFKRACYWFDRKDRFWGVSFSASYGALVTAVEALLPDTIGATACPECKRPVGPSITQAFQRFIEQYAPTSDGTEQIRKRLYRVRSAINHGSKIFRNDVDGGWSLNPTEIEERQLSDELRRAVRISLINWLHDAAGSGIKRLTL